MRGRREALGNCCAESFSDGVLPTAADLAELDELDGFMKPRELTAARTTL